jgi:hypothetical protein
VPPATDVPGRVLRTLLRSGAFADFDGSRLCTSIRPRLVWDGVRAIAGAITDGGSMRTFVAAASGRGIQEVQAEPHRGDPHNSQLLMANQIRYERRGQQPHQRDSRLIQRQLMFGCCGYRVATAAQPDLPTQSQIELREGVQPSSLAASATAEPRQRVFFATSVAWCFDHVAATVTGLIRLEMIECLRTTSG